MFREYKNLVTSSVIRFSQAQVDVISVIDKFDKSFFFLSRKIGIYLYGDVGCGKTMIMDLYMKHTKFKRKCRFHFFVFLSYLHEEIDLKGKSVADVAIEFAKNFDLLLFDEVCLFEISDMMLFSIFFNTLISKRIIVFFTSNYKIETLCSSMRNEYFEMFKQKMIDKFIVLELYDKIDYRELNRGEKCFFFTEYKQFRIVLGNLLGNSNLEEKNMVSKFGNKIVFQYYEQIAVFDFLYLFESSFWIEEYKLIINSFSYIFISNIMSISADNIAYRVILFIDMCYENNIKLVIQSNVLVERIFSTKILGKERAISRIKFLTSH